MYPVRNYEQAARDNENVFRNILRDLKANHKCRPGGLFVPEDLETGAPLDKIFEKYSYGRRYGIFTIIDFSITQTEFETTALIGFEDVATLSGGGARLKYRVEKNGVSYLEPECVFIS